jgi:hypothetical protein
MKRNFHIHLNGLTIALIVIALYASLTLITYLAWRSQ